MEEERPARSTKEGRYVDDVGLYAVTAAREAAQTAGLLPMRETDADDVGLVIGTMTGPMTWADQKLSASVEADHLCPDVSALTAVVGYFGSVIGNVSIPLKLSGASLILTNLDAVGTDAIGYAYDAVRHGKSRIMLAGGADAGLNRFVVSRFEQARLLAAADGPDAANGCGTVLGEGAGILVLEDLESATRRGAHVYAEVLGYEVGIADPVRAIARLLDGADLRPEDVSCIVAHATGYGPADDDETACLSRVFGDAPPPIITSVSWAVGHPLGAAGAIQAVAAVLILEEQRVPVSAAGARVDRRAGPGADAPVSHVMQTTFGFSRRPSFLLFGRLPRA